jgi:hypothetical protein
MKTFQTCADYLLERGVDVMLGFNDKSANPAGVVVCSVGRCPGRGRTAWYVPGGAAKGFLLASERFTTALIPAGRNVGAYGALGPGGLRDVL